MMISTRMRTGLGIATLALSTAVGCSSQGGMGMGGMGMGAMGTSSSMSMSRMNDMMRDWPQASKDAAMFMTNKYGAPAAMTSEMAMWGKTGPWKRTIVFSKEYAHEFPGHHTDVMQQWVDYKAPPAMYDQLAAYDGSVVLERTVGEISARCDKEAANFLALNLADDIVRGKRTVEDARRMYGEQIMAMKAGQPAPYTERLMFSMMMNTNDPDQPGARPSVMVDGK